MDKTLWGNLKSVVKHHKNRFLLGLFFLILSNIFLVAVPLLLRKAIMALGQEGAHLTHVLEWTFFLILIATISGVFEYFTYMTFFGIGLEVEKETRMKIFDRIHSQSRLFFDHHKIGELLSKMVNDITVYRDVIGFALMYFLMLLTMFTLALVGQFIISPKLASIGLLCLIIIPIMHLLTGKKIYQSAFAVYDALEVVSNWVQEHYSGIRIIKSYVVESFAFLRFKETCQKLVNAYIKLILIQGILFPFFISFTSLMMILLVFFSGSMILNAWGGLTIADFISFIWLESYILVPVVNLTFLIPITMLGKAAYDRIVKVYDEPIEVVEGSNNRKISPQAEIVFKDLTFTYPSGKKTIFNNLNLTIKGGGIVGITGPVGSGKSTLIRLINREYEIPEGTIFIDGKDIREYTFEALSSEMVIVEQNPILFTRTLKDNIVCGMEGITDDELGRAVNIADLSESISSFPQSYQTPVGEKGVTLSGGQKQRVAISRAILKDRSILLLDDIFSAVDAKTEMRIFNALKEHLNGKTLIIISHRVSVLEKMDRVVYLFNGEVAEDGPPSELLKKKGHFANLKALQPREML